MRRESLLSALCQTVNRRCQKEYGKKNARAEEELVKSSLGLVRGVAAAAESFAQPRTSVLEQDGDDEQYGNNRLGYVQCLVHTGLLCYFLEKNPIKIFTALITNIAKNAAQKPSI